MRVSEVNPFSITVQWGAVECVHSNGNITGYSLQYTRVQESQSVQTMNVSGGIVTEATISELIPSTTYSIEVAAVNSVGTGVYSDAIYQLTEGRLLTYVVLFRNFVCTLLLLSLPVVAPVLSVYNTRPTSILLSWTSAGTEVERYEVMWTSAECPSDVDEGSDTITDGSISYTIEGLRGGTSYIVTVSATNSAGTASSDPVTRETEEQSERIPILY